MNKHKIKRGCLHLNLPCSSWLGLELNLEGMLMLMLRCRCRRGSSLLGSWTPKCSRRMGLLLRLWVSVGRLRELHLLHLLHRGHVHERVRWRRLRWVNGRLLMRMNLHVWHRQRLAWLWWQSLAWGPVLVQRLWHVLLPRLRR